MTNTRIPILYTQGKDSLGNLIFAKDAEKGFDYFCPLCNTEFILRKSGNTGKGSKRPHFAHKNLTVNCTPETVLHYLFKNKVFEILNDYLKKDLEFIFSWDCQYCNEKHADNLLKKVKKIEIEHNLKKCIPDIALLDEKDNVIIVIEIVVTHDPEEQVIKYYKTNQIHFIQINLESEKQLEDVESKLRKPDITNFCINPVCKRCRKYLLKREMLIANLPCPRKDCYENVKVVTIHHSGKGKSKYSIDYINPNDFSQAEIDFAKSKGVAFAHSAAKDYKASACRRCRTLIEHDLALELFFIPAIKNNLECERFTLEYYCKTCSHITLPT